MDFEQVRKHPKWDEARLRIVFSKELGKELKRIHKTLNMPNVDEHIGTHGIGELLKKQAELSDCLMQIARRHNGLEY